MVTYMRYDVEVPINALSRIDPDLLDQLDPYAIDEETSLLVTFDYIPSTQSDHHDPGSSEEIWIVTPNHLPIEIDDAITEWLYANWERPDEDDDLDPDFDRSRRLNDAMPPRDDSWE